MKYAKINNTDLFASKLVLGTDAFGSSLSCDDSFLLMDEFFDAGGNIIDTASVYADWLGGEKSASEKTIGKWLLQKGCRDKVIISTKGGHPDCNNMRIPRLSKAEIDHDLHNSLINLKTDYIDIYWLHRDDESRSVEEIIDTLDVHVRSGKIRHVGASNWKYERILAANEYAKKSRKTPFIASQIQYSIAKLNEGSLINNMLGMSYGDEEYDRYARDDLAMFSYSSVAKGFFNLLVSGNMEKISDSAKKEYLNDHNLALAEKIKQISQTKNTNVSALMLALLVSEKKLNVFAQVGTRKISHLKEAFEFDKIDLSDEEFDYIMN
ncbi:MAG: aldo/keto reductase [Ruminococcaceae bacterium]|nr:aldo/keto reductase [Oscillospiraceae bacterium]